MNNRRRLRAIAGVIVVAALATGCAQSVSGTAVRVASSSGTQSQDPPPDGPNGLRADAPEPDIQVTGIEQGNQYDRLAVATVDDLYTFYGEVFPKDFGQEFEKAKELISYDANADSAEACGVDITGRVNASYIPSCDTIIWDRGVLMPMMEEQVGELSAPTVLAHEMGHLVQAKLGVERASTLLFEQQADCYAGAYWRWVSDGNSKYFDFAATAGTRQMLSAMMWVGDPVGLSADNDGAHGSAFDRNFAAALGYANGPTRCHEITQAEVDKRIQQTGFTQIPKDFGNIEISDKLIQQVADTLNEYFTLTVQNGYQAPKLEPYTSEQPPACQGSTPTPPVDYCPATHSVRYNLAELKEIGTPKAEWASTNGDFSAVILLASRYGLAAQATGGGQVQGDQAGLRGLCYAGTWAKWLEKPQGKDGLKLTPNDLNKAVYQVTSSSLPASDVNGKTGTSVLDQVQAFHIGVVYDIVKCFDFYGPQQ